MAVQKGPQKIDVFQTFLVLLRLAVLHKPAGSHAKLHIKHLQDVDGRNGQPAGYALNQPQSFPGRIGGWRIGLVDQKPSDLKNRIPYHAFGIDEPIAALPKKDVVVVQIAVQQKVSSVSPPQPQIARSSHPPVVGQFPILLDPLYGSGCSPDPLGIGREALRMPAGAVQRGDQRAVAIHPPARIRLLS